MPDVPAKLTETLELLSLLPERGDRIELLIDTADRFQEVPEAVARRPFSCDNRVPACESEAFVWALPQPDRTLKFHFAVENPQGISAMALAVILDEALSGAPPEQVSRVPDEVVYDIFGKELSMGKSMGLTAMVTMVRRSAARYLEALSAG